jgi:hypothetical protein
MALELHQNSCARTAQPGIWIFKGTALLYLVVGFGVFILSMQIMSAAQVDFPIAVVISAMPLSGLTIFVRFFVNGKPPSYAIDVLLQGVWSLKTRLYKLGVVSRAPHIWPMPYKPAHPKDF